MKETMKWISGLLACIFLMVGLPAVASAAGDRSYASAHYMLELDGVNAGFFKSFEGGAITADVVTEQVGPDKVQRKHVGKPRYGEITIAVGAGMSKGVHDWISQTLKRQPSRKSGAILSLDHRLAETQRLTFTNAVITEITFPAADGSSKEPAYTILKLQPEYVQYSAGSNASKAQSAGKQEGKIMLPFNFRLSINGIDTTKVNKVDALTIKIPAQESAVGSARDSQYAPGLVRIPNVVLEMAEASAQTLRAWHYDFVIRGLSGQDKEKSGQLLFYSPNQKDILLTLDLKNLGIFKIEPVADKVNQQISRVRAEMYCEDILATFAAPGK